MQGTVGFRESPERPVGVFQRLSAALPAGRRVGALLSVTVLLVGCAGGRIEELEQQVTRQQTQLEQLHEEAAEQSGQLESAREAVRAAEQARDEARAQRQEERDRLQAALEEAQARARREAARAEELQQAREALEVRQAVQQRERRIGRLESELAEIRDRITRGEQANDRMRDAIVAAEELLQMLDSEQQKYDEVDAAGQTRVPLQKGLIEEQEERLDRLVEQARSLSR